jgi:hypothetical protein
VILASILFTNVMKHLVGNSVGAAAVTLLRDGELDELLATCEEMIVV